MRLLLISREQLTEEIGRTTARNPARNVQCESRRSTRRRSWSWGRSVS